MRQYNQRKPDKRRFITLVVKNYIIFMTHGINGNKTKVKNYGKFN